MHVKMKRKPNLALSLLAINPPLHGLQNRNAVSSEQTTVRSVSQLFIYSEKRSMIEVLTAEVL